MLNVLDKVKTPLGEGIIYSYSRDLDIYGVALDVLIDEAGDPILFTEDGYYKTTDRIFTKELIHNFSSSQLTLINQ